jgi:hypothetical protein
MRGPVNPSFSLLVRPSEPPPKIELPPPQGKSQNRKQKTEQFRYNRAPVTLTPGSRLGPYDPWITIQDLYLLLESGEPKSARVYPEGGHMGAGAETGKQVMNWLKAQLAR